LWKCRRSTKPQPLVEVCFVTLWNVTKRGQKLGRPSIGKQAMTALDRQQRRRAKLARIALRKKEALAKKESRQKDLELKRQAATPTMRHARIRARRLRTLWPWRGAMRPRRTRGPNGTKLPTNGPSASPASSDAALSAEPQDCERTQPLLPRPQSASRF
jgi:hypothetical protein